MRPNGVTDASTALTPMQQAEQLRGQQRHADALAIYERVLRANPRDRGAYTMRAITLSDLGSAQLAAEAMWRHPDWFSQERERIENDRVARMIGWASAEPIDSAHRYAETDQALVNVARIERESPPTLTWEATRLRVDSLVALNQRQRHRDVVANYQALKAEGIEVPAYVLPTVGDSLMGLRRPAEAEAVLRQALQHNPTTSMRSCCWAMPCSSRNASTWRCRCSKDSRPRKRRGRAATVPAAATKTGIASAQTPPWLPHARRRTIIATQTPCCANVWPSAPTMRSCRRHWPRSNSVAGNRAPRCNATRWH